jgi:hypothetical protein
MRHYDSRPFRRVTLPLLLCRPRPQPDRGRNPRGEESETREGARRCAWARDTTSPKDTWTTRPPHPGLRGNRRSARRPAELAATIASIGFLPSAIPATMRSRARLSSAAKRPTSTGARRLSSALVPRGQDDDATSPEAGRHEMIKLSFAPGGGVLGIVGPDPTPETATRQPVSRQPVDPMTVPAGETSSNRGGSRARRAGTAPPPGARWRPELASSPAVEAVPSPTLGRGAATRRW